MNCLAAGLLFINLIKIIMINFNKCSHGNMKQLKHAELYIYMTYTSKEIKKYSRVPEKRYTQIAGEHGSHIISFLLLEGFSASFGFI